MVYNLLSKNDLTGGLKIAGTGTINLDGTVGPIGGVKQKVFAAEGWERLISYVPWKITQMLSLLRRASR